MCVYILCQYMCLFVYLPTAHFLVLQYFVSMGIQINIRQTIYSTTKINLFHRWSTQDDPDCRPLPGVEMEENVNIFISSKQFAGIWLMISDDSSDDADAQSCMEIDRSMESLGNWSSQGTEQDGRRCTHTLLVWNFALHYRLLHMKFYAPT